MCSLLEITVVPGWGGAELFNRQQVNKGMHFAGEKLIFSIQRDISNKSFLG
jgi:hypothetical protein